MSELALAPAFKHLTQAWMRARVRSYAEAGRIPTLDGFRAFAILIVMFSHAGFGHVVPGGFGVTVFFFLSGYLITTLLRKESESTGRIDLRQFYLRRSIRIFPPFYLTIAVICLLIAFGLIDRTVTSTGLIMDALFLSNYASVFGVSGTVPTPLWSLDVEEHFYLLFSIVFAMLFVRLSSRRAALFCAIACALILLGRVLSVLAMSDLTDVYYWSHTRMDSILFGCCLALWHNPVMDRGAWRPKPWQVGLALLTLAGCIVVRDAAFRETIRYTLQGIALFVLFSAAIQAGGIVHLVMDSRPVRLVALLSYTLYLAHMPALLLFERLAVPAHAIWGFAAAFGYAWMMHRLVEKPLAGWRRGLAGKPQVTTDAPH